MEMMQSSKVATKADERSVSADLGAPPSGPDVLESLFVKPREGARRLQTIFSRPRREERNSRFAGLLPLGQPPAYRSRANVLSRANTEHEVASDLEDVVTAEEQEKNPVPKDLGALGRLPSYRSQASVLLPGYTNSGTATTSAGAFRQAGSRKKTSLLSSFATSKAKQAGPIRSFCAAADLVLMAEESSDRKERFMELVASAIKNIDKKSSVELPGAIFEKISQLQFNKNDFTDAMIRITILVSAKFQGRETKGNDELRNFFDLALEELDQSTVLDGDDKLNVISHLIDHFPKFSLDRAAKRMMQSIEAVVHSDLQNGGKNIKIVINFFNKHRNLPAKLRTAAFENIVENVDSLRIDRKTALYVFDAIIGEAGIQSPGNIPGKIMQKANQLSVFDNASKISVIHELLQKFPVENFDGVQDIFMDLTSSVFGEKGSRANVDGIVAVISELATTENTRLFKKIFSYVSEVDPKSAERVLLGSFLKFAEEGNHGYRSSRVRETFREVVSSFGSRDSFLENVLTLTKNKITTGWREGAYGGNRLLDESSALERNKKITSSVKMAIDLLGLGDEKNVSGKIIDLVSTGINNCSVVDYVYDSGRGEDLIYAVKDAKQTLKPQEVVIELLEASLNATRNKKMSPEAVSELLSFLMTLPPYAGVVGRTTIYSYTSGVKMFKSEEAQKYIRSAICDRILSLQEDAKKKTKFVKDLLSGVDASFLNEKQIQAIESLVRESGDPGILPKVIFEQRERLRQEKAGKSRFFG